MKILSIAIAVLLACAASFFVGTRIGVVTFSRAEAQYNASITAAELRLLEQPQHVDQLKQSKEIELNGHLAEHGRYMNSQLKWLWPDLISKDNRPIISAARYRATHAFDEPDMSKPDSWDKDVDLDSPFVREVIAGQKENQALVKEVLDTYSP